MIRQIMLSTALMFLLMPVIGYAAELPGLPESLVIKALAGEAGGQSEAELIAHAHAIANRGHLKGVYGLRAKVSATALKRAKLAYAKSRLVPDTVNGADHWLSDYDLRHSMASLIAWRHKAVYRVKVGSTTFYRLK